MVRHEVGPPSAGILDQMTANGLRVLYSSLLRDAKQQRV